jgi:MFS family permease
VSLNPLGWLVYRGNRPFTWLWWSQTISLFGSQVTIIAIPLLAFLSLGASAMEMGLLAAVETLPYLIFSIPAGVLVDRVDRRGLLVVTNVLRATMLLAVPAAAAVGLLSLPLLYAVAFAVGTLSVVFDVAYQSYVPELLRPGELLRGNQRIELSESAARTVGPTIGGSLVAVLGGATAVIVDAASYLLASVALLGAGRPRAATSDAGPPAIRSATPERRQGAFDIWEYAESLESRVAELEARLVRGKPARRRAEGVTAGLRIVLGDRILRDMAISTSVFNLASAAIIAVFFLFAARDLGLGPTEIGMLFGIGNVGFVVGALVVGIVTSRFGVGPTLIASAIGGALATVVMPFASGVFAVGILLFGRFLGAFTIPLFNVNARALRQSRAPIEALGRVNSIFRLIDWGTLPVGALMGGWVGEQYGLRETLAAAAVLGVASALWLVVSPLRAVRRLDEPGRQEAQVTVAGSPSAGGGWGRRWAGLAGEVLSRPVAAFGRLPTIRLAWLAIAGALVQAALSIPAVNSQLGGAPPFLYVLSSVAVLVCLLANLRIPGLAIAAIGGLSNLVAITANGGYMPVDPAAARIVGHAPPTGYTHTIEAVAVYLRPLTDIILVPPPLPLANVYSIGDLLLLVGLSVTFVAALHGWAARPLEAAAASEPEGVASGPQPRAESTGQA